MVVVVVVMVVVVVVVMVAAGRFLVDHALNLPEHLHMARNINRAFLIKPIFFLSLLQQLHKEWVVYVHHRDYKPLLLLTLPHHHSQTPLWNVFQIFFSMVMEMKMETKVIGFFSTTHLPKKKGTQENIKKTQDFEIRVTRKLQG